MNRANIGCILIFGIAMISCAGTQGRGPLTSLKESTAATASKLATATRMPSMAGLFPESRLKIVEVREEDLKKLPTGHERAIAFHGERQRGPSFFGGPVDFIEPELPAAGVEMDGSLLPPPVP